MDKEKKKRKERDNEIKDEEKKKAEETVKLIEWRIEIMEEGGRIKTLKES